MKFVKKKKNSKRDSGKD